MFNKVGRNLMSAKKSPRNKTIDFTLEEGKEYVDRVVPLSSVHGYRDMINKTIHGDTFEAVKKIPDESIDLIVVDPPYNLSKNYHGNSFNKMKTDEYSEFTREWLEEAKRVLSPEGTIYVCCDWKTSMIIGPLIAETFQIKNRITWQREKGRGAKTNWKNSMEDIWFATKSNSYTFNLDDVKVRRKVIAPYREAGKPKDWEESEKGNYRDTSPSNFWDDITVPFWSMPENTGHPTQKPEKLVTKLILASSNPGDIVLDLFVGSGTTSVVAKKLNRDYIGIEQNLLYCAWAEYRLEMAEMDPSIQGYADGVFWERNSLEEQKAVKKKKKKEAKQKELNLFSLMEDQNV